MMEIGLWIAAVILIVLAAVDSGYVAWWFHKCRHRGKFPYEVKWPGLFTGLHRGKYVEKPEWTEKEPPKVLDDGTFVWDSTVIFPGGSSHEPCTLTLGPASGMLTLPALTWSSEEKGIRKIVQDELAATPIYTGLSYEKYGRFGDVDIDQADSTLLCGSPATGADSGE